MLRLTVAAWSARTQNRPRWWWLSRYRWTMSRLTRITSDPAICHGQPTVRGLRYPVETLLELLSSGMTIEEVLADYPDLEREDLLVALEDGDFVELAANSLVVHGRRER